MDQVPFFYLCCNPFDKANHSSKRKNLRSVLPWMCKRIHSIQVGAKICDECRKQLGKLPIPDPTTESSECTPVTESSESVHLSKVMRKVILAEILKQNPAKIRLLWSL